MRIRAKTESGREVYIVQFVTHGSGLFAVTIDYKGRLQEYAAYKLTVIDTSYVASVVGESLLEIRGI